MQLPGILARAAVAAGVLLAALGATSASAAVSVTQVTHAPEGGEVVFTLQSSVPLGETVSVSTQDGTAKAGEDYTRLSNPVQYVSASGTDVRVATTADDVLEQDETFTLVADPPLSDAARAQGIIRNDDAPQLVSGAAPTPEGASITVAVALTAPTTKEVTVALSTADRSAVAPGDYAATSETVRFAPGEQVKAVAVPTAQDQVFEADEALEVRFADATNATAPAGPVVATIAEDDPRPRLTLEGAPPVAEGDSGLTITGARLRLSAPAAVPVRVVVATGESSAKAGADFEPMRSEVVFAPGETDKVALVSVKGDTEIEKDERFFFLAAAGEHVDVEGGLASVVLEIRNDDRDTVAPRLVLSKLVLRGRTLRTTVACPPGEVRCTGRVTFFKDADRRSRDSRLRREVRLGRVAFRVDGGTAQVVRLTLSESRRALLRRARRPKVSAYALGADAAGNRTTARRSARLAAR